MPKDDEAGRPQHPGPKVVALVSALQTQVLGVLAEARVKAIEEGWDAVVVIGYSDRSGEVTTMGSGGRSRDAMIGAMERAKNGMLNG